MEYVILIWKNPKKMANIEPKEKKGKLAAMKEAISSAASAAGLGEDEYVQYNPDMLIDKDAAGDDVITAIDIAFENKDINIEPGVTRKVKLAKIGIKGNLYLPIKGSLEADAASMLGKSNLESKKKNTLRLAEWAQLQPTADKEEGYYRGISISVITKAGDFRVINANNVYVESYEEDYSAGEFGTFELHLSQRADVTSAVKVTGLNEQSESVAAQIKGAISAAADKAGKAAAVVGTVAAVGKVATNIGNQVIETVETYVGETEATRRAKQAMKITGNAMDITSSAGNIVEASKEKDKNKKAQAIMEELDKASGKVTDSVQEGYNADTDVEKIQALETKVQKMETTYLDKLSEEEKAVYDRMDNAGKVKMLSAKKSLIEHELEVEKNKAIIDKNTKK